MDIVFKPDGNFDEVYLYVRAPVLCNFVESDRMMQEELMEADLHAIVSAYGHVKTRKPDSFIRFAPANRSRMRTSSPSCTRPSAVSNTFTQRTSCTAT